MLSIFGARTRAFETSESPSAQLGPPTATVLRRLSADVKVRVLRTPPPLPIAPDGFDGDRLVGESLAASDDLGVSKWVVGTATFGLSNLTPLVAAVDSIETVSLREK